MSEATEPERSRPEPGEASEHERITDREVSPEVVPDSKAEPAAAQAVTASPGGWAAGPAAAVPAPPRRRGRRALLASVVVLVLVLGGAVGAAGLFYRSVQLPRLLTFPSATTLYYSDGQTVLARLGEINRTPLAFEKLAPSVTQAAVAAADPGFWTDDAGPITRSVARTAFDLEGTGMSSRARLFVVAHKLSASLSREKILNRYLNDSYFGRRTWGIEAAAREYFGKTADRTAGDSRQLSMAEAIVLVSMLDQPEPDSADPQGRPGFDPSRGAKAAENSRRRWNEVRDELVKLRYVSSADAQAMAYPTGVRPYDEQNLGADLAKPSGLVASHVLAELTAEGSPLHGMAWRSIRDGGYKIVTTINPKAQEALEKSANGKVAGSPMAGQPANLQAAGVIVEPGTGRVLAYYGGADGMGSDYAGFYRDETGRPVGFGRHPSGSAFFVHTLAAALNAGYSLNSYWSWQPYDMAGRMGPNRIRNSSVCPSGKERSGACSLLDSTVQSLNVPLYAVTSSVSAVKVLEMARAAGIDTMWNDSREPTDLAGITDLKTVVPSRFDTILGLGQYPVTVLDQANAMATYAAGGLRAEAHFVSRVMSEEDNVVYGERLPSPNQPRIVRAEAIADLTYALSQSPAGKLPGRDSASKPGSWEYNGAPNQNSNAWMVGYTSSLAMAVWIGNVAEEKPIMDKTNGAIWGSGLPATIYRDVMNAAHDGMALKPAAFGPPANLGATNPPGSVPR